MSGGFEKRPWGGYEVLLDEPTYKVKRLTVSPGKRLSLQYHHKRNEHWYVVAGRGDVVVADRQIPVEPGAAVDIGRAELHRLACTGDEDLVVIEIQRGEYFGEDDIVRVEDDFGRLEE
ncbi:MAG: phosphomannose isomerase type II C-terminal cupin domain [Deltaproteobacteria bacterium]|nr:phosphomannose isomerase type II C-terminal cupin domain [Deltaproteobacteria bacterium]